MLARYAGVMGCDTSSFSWSGFNALPDSGEVESWAREAMAWCVDAGVMGGVSKDDGMWLDPDDAARRAQMAKMITVIDRDLLG